MTVSEDITDLTANETYYFRIVAENASGISFGAELYFSTGFAPFLSVLPTNQDVSAPAGTTEFNVSSNIDWTTVCDAPWCTVTQAPWPVGDGEMTANELRIYPNPNSGAFNIVPADNHKGRIELTIQDLNGLVILKSVLEGEKEYQIDLSTRPQGLYHILVKTKNTFQVRKLVIVR
ncbi:MAG: T9SS type A sorting domain-containing protein [Bacteroidales bacterium]|nr:T9SS type A sorting domain-containing protein [Bacteroidales bacterium]